MDNKKEPSYGMTETARLLGITRQAAYIRLEREKWFYKQLERVSIPASTIKKSRERERMLLWNRLNELDALAKEQELIET